MLIAITIFINEIGVVIMRQELGLRRELGEIGDLALRKVLRDRC